MSKSEIILVITLIIILGIQIIKYVFPHFGMHILKPSAFNILDFDSFDFENCKHTEEEIKDYKRMQLIWLCAVIALVIFIIVLYLKSKLT